MLKLLTMLFVMPALAQSDQYWQQLSANRAAQCDMQIVQLLKTLDDQKKQVDELKKQLEEAKAGKDAPVKPKQ